MDVSAPQRRAALSSTRHAAVPPRFHTGVQGKGRAGGVVTPPPPPPPVRMHRGAFGRMTTVFCVGDLEGDDLVSCVSVTLGNEETDRFFLVSVTLEGDDLFVCVCR